LTQTSGDIAGTIFPMKQVRDPARGEHAEKRIDKISF
jgi:hypothetical protein